MIYSYLPCQILGHDFDEKSDFLNYEFSKHRHYSIKKWLSSKESWVERGCDVIQSKTSKQTWLLKYAEEECDGQVVALFDWMTSHPPSAQLSLLN